MAIIEKQGLETTRRERIDPCTPLKARRAMARRGSSITLTVDVYEQIRQEILTGKLAPGTPLRPSELGTRLSVSIGVVREALTRLAAQRLVDSEHNRGFHVITLSADKLGELVSARQLNECHALELSVQGGDVNWESEVVAAHHRMVNTPVYRREDRDHTNDAFLAEHKKFHFTLLNACGNRYLLEICNQLIDAAEVYRRWSAPMIDRRSNAAQEHRDIMDAALARDAKGAARLYAAHIGITADLVVRRFDADPTGREGS